MYKMSLHGKCVYRGNITLYMCMHAWICYVNRPRIMISCNAPARFPQLGEVAFFQCFGLLLQYSFRISTSSEPPDIAKLFTSPFPQLSPLNPFPSLNLFSVEMPPERKPKIFAYADFDLRALCSLASALRRGIPCACDRDQLPASGSYHWVVFISFADQVRWVFRSPLIKESMPVEMRAKIIASEVATLRCVKTYSNIPVPEVYYHW